MAERIDDNKIFSSNFLEKTKEGFREMLKLIGLVKDEMKDVLKVQQEIIKTSDKKTEEGLKKRAKAITKVNEVSKQMLKLEKQRKTASAQLAIAETKEAKAVAGTRLELSKKKKAVLDEIRVEKGLISAYDIQRKKLRQLKADYKSLIIVQKGETLETRRLRKEARKLEKELARVDRRVKSSTGLMSRLKSGVARLALAFGGLAIIRNVFNIVKDFEQSQADLASVLGVSVDEMKELTDQARELGATTRFTAGEVAGLQKEFAKLGFDSSEIENMTEATLSLAAATGTELARAAEVTGATLRGFGLAASETQRVVDVMAKSFTSSSLDMEKFATAMSSVAPVAKTAGLTIERTTALLGTLTDRGLDASTAGTGLRNIFLELSKRGITFEQAMLKINSASDKNAASLELFGKRGATVGTILSETSAQVGILEEKLKDAGGAAEEMANKQLNTLNGQLDLLKSAWEGFILDLEAGTGVFAGLKDVIGFVARNLGTIIKVLVVAASAFATYKLTILATTVVTRAAAAAQIAFAAVQALLTGNIKRATAAMRLFNIAVKLSPIGLLVTLIGAAITAYVLFADTTSNAEKAQNAFNESLKITTETTTELINKLKEQIIEEERIIALQLKRGEISSEEADKLRIKSIKEQKKELRGLIRVEIDAQETLQLGFEKQRENLFEEQRRLKKFGVSGSKFAIEALDKQILENNIKLNSALGERENILINLEDRFDILLKKEQAIAAEEISIEINKNEKIDKERKKAREKRAKELALFRRMLEDLDNEAIIDDEERQKETLKTKFRREIEAIKGNAQVEIELRNELKLKELRLLFEIEQEFNKKRAADAFETVQVIGEQEKEQLAEQIKLKEIAAEKELELQLKIASERPEDVNVDKLEDLLNQRFDLIKRALEDERDLLLLNEDLTNEQRELINIKFNNKLAENQRKRVEIIDDANDEIIDAQIETSERLAEIEKQARLDALAAEKKILEDRLAALRSFAEKAIELLDAKTDKEIENIDKELAANKTRQQQLARLAEEGNLTAEQSISAEIKRELELERQKEALEKKKARRQIILEGLDLLSSKIDAGETDAVTSTLNDMTRLLSALAFLPAFIGGTETTVGAALGTPHLNTGTDDYIVRVDKDEKILNPKLSAKTGGATTTQIVDGFLRDQSHIPDESALIRPQVVALHTPYQNTEQLMKGFSSLEKVIKNKPGLVDFKWDEVAKAMIVTIERDGELENIHYKS